MDKDDDIAQTNWIGSMKGQIKILGDIFSTGAFDEWYKNTDAAFPLEQNTVMNAEMMEEEPDETPT